MCNEMKYPLRQRIHNGTFQNQIHGASFVSFLILHNIIGSEVRPLSVLSKIVQSAHFTFHI